MTKRDMLPMVLLWFFTLGIYPLVWHFKFQDEVKAKTNEGFTGITHLLLLFVTFGFYYLYWTYATGKRLAAQGGEDNSVLYLVLSFVPVASAFVPFMIQSQANQLN